MSPRRSPAPAGRESGRIAAWIVGLQAAVTGVGSLLASHRAGSLAVQAFVAEWGAGRLGVAWSDPDAPPPSARLVARRIGGGLALGLGAALLAVSFAALTRAVVLTPVPAAPAELALGLVVAGLISLRDELLLRGLVLRAFGGTLSPGLRLLACGAVAAATKLGQTETGSLSSLSALSDALPSLLAAGLGGVCFAILWLRERGAFRAWGAHVAWGLVTTTAISGGVADAHWSATRWGGGPLGFDASFAVVSALAVVTCLALSKWYRDDARTR